MPASNQGTASAFTHSTTSPIQSSFSPSSGGGTFAGTNPRILTTNSPIRSKSPKRVSSLQNWTSSCQCAKQWRPPKSPRPTSSSFNAPDEAPPSIHIPIDHLPTPNSSSQSWHTLLTHGAAPWTRFTSPTQSKDTTAMFFFSGMTGLPKATQITHRNSIAQHTLAYNLAYNPHQRPYPISAVLSIPMFHIGITPLTFRTQLRDGRTAHIIRRFDVESFLEVHAGFQVTDLLIVPPIVDAIVMSGLADPKDQKYREECSLRSVQYGIDNTLQNVDNFRIEWINTLNLHLQLDVQERVLRLFRFPSFSWLLHQGDYDLSSSEDDGLPVTSFLFQMFADHNTDHKKSLLEGDPMIRMWPFPNFAGSLALVPTHIWD